MLIKYFKISCVFIIVLTLCALGHSFAEEIPKRIVSLSPSNTEILFALGLDKRIVGVSDWEDYPPEVEKKARVGGLTPNLEAIVMLQPDLIIADISQARPLFILRDIGFHIEITHSTRAKDFNDVLEIILFLGRLTGEEQQAEKLVSRMKASIEKVKQKVIGLSRPRVYYETWSVPMIAAGGETLQSKFIEEAGGVNIAAGLRKRNSKVSTEFLLLGNPDIIVHPGVITDKELDRRVGWGDLKAVQDELVYSVDRGIFSKAGPRIVDALEQMAKILHPEVFEGRGNL